MKYTQMNLIRGILYGVAISLAIGLPSTPPNETTCPYSAFLAPKYIGEKVGIIERKSQPVVMHGSVCNTYLGFPFIYIADLYDVKPTQVSLTRLILNLFTIVIVIEIFIFGAIKISKSRKIEINKAI